jgi:hypothetical protein
MYRIILSETEFRQGLTGRKEERSAPRMLPKGLTEINASRKLKVKKGNPG